MQVLLAASKLALVDRPCNVNRVLYCILSLALMTVLIATAVDDVMVALVSNIVYCNFLLLLCRHVLMGVKSLS